MSTLDDYLANLPGRCAHGFSPEQHPRFCACTAKSESAEFAIFVAALQVASTKAADGLIHQTDVRPLIQRIPHKHRGQLYRKARAAGLIEVAGKEPSTDERGRNTDKEQRVYRMRGAA